MSAITRHRNFLPHRVSRKIPLKRIFSPQDGTIGSELVIRPLPERVLQEVVSNEPALREPALLPNLTESDLRRTNHHVVFKKVDRPVADDEYGDFCECTNDTERHIEAGTMYSYVTRTFQRSWNPIT